MGNKLLYIISLIVIIVGIIIIATLKFNYGLEFGEYTRINVYMTEKDALEDVRAIVKELFEGKFNISYTDEFKDTISIKANGLSEDKLKEIKDKLVEKYEFDDEDNYISVINTSRIRIFDLIRDYIKPVIISFVLILIFTTIYYRKLGIFKSLIKPMILIIIINTLYISILAICRIPINEYIIPIGIFVYIMSILGIMIKLNNEKMEAQ